MGERLFDELARALAEPMPRRRVLRLAGAALVGVTVPGLRPRFASARVHPNAARVYPNITCGSLCQGKGSPCGIDFTDKFGQTSCKLGCCVGQNTGQDICCKGKDLGGEPTAWCCGKSYRCGRTGEQLCVGCSPGQFLCADKRCCRNDQVCSRGECRDKCPPKTKKCGKNCCTLKQGCRKGKCCDTCGENGGPCCDSATEYCCREPGDKKSPGRCCKKDAESCCPVGPPGAGKRTCCPKPNKCKRQLLVKRSGEASPWSAPRPAGQSEGLSATAGYVSLGSKLVLPGGGGGLCCRADRSALRQRASLLLDRVRRCRVRATCCNGPASTSVRRANCGAAAGR
jgi:hypothetical protein